MNVVADRRAISLDAFRRELCPLAVEQHQLGTAGEETGRSGLVLLDMGFAVADHALMRLAHRGQRQRIGGRAGRHPQGFNLGFEQVGESAVKLPAQPVAVIGGVLPIGFDQRFQQLGVHRRSIIREKSHGQRMAQSFWRVKI